MTQPRDRPSDREGVRRGPAKGLGKNESTGARGRTCSSRCQVSLGIPGVPTQRYSGPKDLQAESWWTYLFVCALPGPVSGSRPSPGLRAVRPPSGWTPF